MNDDFGKKVLIIVQQFQSQLLYIINFCWKTAKSFVFAKFIKISSASWRAGKHIIVIYVYAGILERFKINPGDF